MMDIFESLDTKDHQWKVLLCYNCALAFLCAPKGEAYSRRFVRPSVRYLVRRITLKLLLTSLPCILTELSPLVIMVACPGHILESEKGLKLNLVHTYMLMTESAGDRNHTPILHFTSVLNYFS